MAARDYRASRYYSQDATARKLDYGDENSARQQRRKSSPQVSKMAIFQLTVWLGVTLAAGGLAVSQYEKISRLTTATDAIQSEIDIYTDELDALGVDLACAVDISSVTQKAASYGMEYPAAEQVITLPLEKTAPAPLERSSRSKPKAAPETPQAPDGEPAGEQ